jgi:hypothetical protein
MGKFVTTTGLGYFKDAQDNIIGKCELPVGEHSLTDGLTFVEVATIEELNGIEIYVPLENKINHVKAIAKQKIIALLPSTSTNYRDAEANLLARKGELLRKEFKSSISASELSELDALETLWSQIKEIRVASNQIEVAVTNDPSYDYTNSNLWPI